MSGRQPNPSLRLALVVGFALGLAWALGELTVARPASLGAALDPLAFYVALAVLAVLVSHAFLGGFSRARARRTPLACALGAGGIAATVVFVRAHFGLIPNEPWTSTGHLIALGSALAVGALAAAGAFAATRRAERVDWIHSPWVVRSVAALSMLAAVSAVRSTIPRFDARVEAASVECTAPYNVLLITLDTLRADHLTSYGYDKPTSEALTRFGFTRFEQAFATSPWTRPSTGTILSGVYPSVHTAVYDDAALPADVVTLAERLQAVGFATAHCAANINASGVFGMAQGAEFTVRDPYLVPHPLADTTLGELLRRRSYKLQDARDLARMASAFLDAAARRRFFLYFHCEDPHTPYDPPRELLESYAPGYRGRVFTSPRPQLNMSEEEVRHMVARYDGDITNATAAVGTLLEELDRRGLLDETLVILTADHGEAFNEHGFWHHSTNLYEELLRIPLLVRPPAGLARTSVVDAAASQIDLVPTVLDYLGLEPEGDLPGISLRPFVEGRKAEGEDRLLLAECHRIDAWSVRLGRWKLIVTKGRTELYDLEHDPRERADLSGDPAQSERLRSLLDRGLALRSDLQLHSITREQLENSGSVRSLLRELGYGGDEH